MSATTRFFFSVTLLVLLSGSIYGIANAKQLGDEDLFAAAQLVDSNIIDDALAFTDANVALADFLAGPAVNSAMLVNVMAAPGVSGLDDDANEAKDKSAPDLDNVEEEVQDGPQDANLDEAETKGVEDAPGGLESNHEFDGEEQGEH